MNTYMEEMKSKAYGMIGQQGQQRLDIDEWQLRVKLHL